MTVRVSKPAFNLREKLSELDVPVGSHGGRIMQSSSAEETFDLVRVGRKNMVINGGMYINQRNGTSSYTPTDGTGTYGGPDRWCVGDWTDGSLSVNMDGDPLNYPEVSMFSKAMQIACSGTDTSMASNQNTHFFQNIEGYNIAHLGWGTRSAKPVTLSFWVKTNCAGYYNVGLMNSATDRTNIKQFYHNGSHMWQKFVLTYPGCGDGTWLKTNGIGIRIRFCLASGTQYDDGVEGQWTTTDELHIGTQTNFMSSTSNRFFITGVQLEEGSVATPFEHRSYSEELALCQRYFTVWPPRSGGIPAWPVYTGGSQASAHVWIPHTMRTVPTPTDKGTGTSTTTGHAYNNNGNSVSTRYANGTSPTLSCGGDSINGHFGLNMHFGAYSSSGHEADTASWNGTSPGIFLSAEL